MKEIISKRSKKAQNVSDETWEAIVTKGMDNRFTVRDIVEKVIKHPPEIIPDKKKKNG